MSSLCGPVVLTVLVSVCLFCDTCHRPGTRLCILTKGPEITWSKHRTLKMRDQLREARSFAQTHRAKKQLSREANLVHFIPG